MLITILLIIVGLAVWGFFIIKARDKSEAIFMGITVMFFYIPLSFLPVYFTGFHYETGRGEHVGYVTATQKQGILFKTGRAYVKTDNQSSQEENYCVIDENVYEKLNLLSKERKLVTVKYFSWLFAGVKNCQGEGDIIYEVVEH